MALVRTDGLTDNRYYYDTETLKFYISATSFCTAVLPENPYLVEWKQKMGILEAKRASKIAALYGTLFHILAEEFLGMETYSINQFNGRIEEFIYDNKIEDIRMKWIKELKNDMLAFAQFVFDKKVDPINLEQWVKKDMNSMGGIAGTIDLECYLTFNRNKTHAIVDLKSGRKGFYDSHILQLFLYKEIVPCDLIFNWAPVDWKKEVPTYHFANQTNSSMGQKLEHYLHIAEADGLFTPKIKQLDFKSISRGKQPVFEIKTMKDLMVENE